MVINLTRSVLSALCRKFRFWTKLTNYLKKHLLCVPFNQESVDAVIQLIYLVELKHTWVCQLFLVKQVVCYWAIFLLKIESDVVWQSFLINKLE